MNRLLIAALCLGAAAGCGRQPLKPRPRVVVARDPLVAPPKRPKPPEESPAAAPAVPQLIQVLMNIPYHWQYNKDRTSHQVLTLREQERTAWGKVFEAVGPEVARQLTERLVRSKDTETPMACVRVLAFVGKPAVRPVLAALEETVDGGTRWYLHTALRGVGPAAVEDLREAARSPRPRRAAEAIFALSHLGPAAAPAAGEVRLRLHDPSAEVRAFAAFALGNMGRAAAAAAPDLRSALADPDHLVRLGAAYALSGRVADERDRAVSVVRDLLHRLDQRSVPPLTPFLPLDSDPLRTIAALAARPALAPQQQRGERELGRWALRLAADDPTMAALVGPELVGLMRRDDWYEDAATAFVRVGESGRAGVPVLLERLRGGRASARSVLIALGPKATGPSLPALRRLLEGGEPAVRWLAFQVLAANHRAETREIVPGLGPLVDGAAETARQRTKWEQEARWPLFLNGVWASGDNVVLTVPDFVMGGMNEVRARTVVEARLLFAAWVVGGRDGDAARVALGRSTGPAAREAAALLVTRLHRSNAGEIARPLAGLGAEGAAALVAALDRKPADPRPQLLALRAMGAKGHAALPAVRAALRHRDYDVRAAAAAILGSWGAAARPAVPDLAGALRDSHAEVRSAALDAVARVGPDAAAAVPALVAALETTDHAFRLRVLDALGRVGVEAAPAVPALVRLLEDGSHEVRREAVRALGRIGKPAVRPLIAALDADSPAMRRGAAEALGRIGPEAKPAVPFLLRLAARENEPPENYAAARQALRVLDPP